MTVDLSTLKVGDDIKLRNGDVHKVVEVIRHTDFGLSGIRTESPRVTYGNGGFFLYCSHHQNGRCGTIWEFPGDITEIIPAPENVAAGVEHSIDWMEKEIKVDAVNSPSHYTDGNIEVIDYILDKQLGFCLGNAIKYISRAGKKDPSKRVEDLAKAIWYLQRQIKEWENGK